MKKFTLAVAYCMSVALIGSCSTQAESISANAPASSNMSEQAATTPEPVRPTPAADSKELCKQLHEIKKFPGRDPSEAEDPFYAAIIALGEEVMPCLVDEITNESPMEDPRSAPVWEHYKVGDTAVFLLARITKDQDILKEMLPSEYREEWKTNGVYAYFNYVSRTEHRRELQAWWLSRLTQKRRTGKPR